MRGARRGFRAILLAAAITLIPFSGCVENEPTLLDDQDPTRTKPGAREEPGGARPAPTGPKQGTPSSGDLEAASVGLVGDLRLGLDGTLALQLERPGVVKHPFWLLEAVELSTGERGRLVSLGENLTLRSASLETRFASVALADGRLYGRLVEDDVARAERPEAEAFRSLPEEARRKVEGDLFWARSRAMSASGPVVVEGGELHFVEASGAVRALGTRASLAAFARAFGTGEAPVDYVGEYALAPPDAKRRLSVLANVTAGTVELDGAPRSVRGETALTILPERFTIEPTTSGVAIGFKGLAFQLIERGRSHLTASLAVALDKTRFDLPVNGSEEVRVRFVESGGRGDAIIRAIRVEGNADHFGFPGFVFLTETYLKAIEPLPAPMQIGFVLAVPAFAIADLFLGIFQAIFGPPKIPQAIGAQSLFETRLTVNALEAPGRHDVVLVVEGENFETARIPVTIDVRPASAR